MHGIVKLARMKLRSLFIAVALLGMAFTMTGCAITPEQKARGIGIAQTRLDQASAIYAATTQATAAAESVIPLAPPKDQPALISIAKTAESQEATAKSILIVAQRTLDQARNVKSFDPSDPGFQQMIAGVAAAVVAAIPGGAPFSPLVGILVPSLAAIGASVFAGRRHANAAQAAQANTSQALEVVHVMATSNASPPAIVPPVVV